MQVMDLATMATNQLSLLQEQVAPVVGKAPVALVDHPAALRVAGPAVGLGAVVVAEVAVVPKLAAYSGEESA